MLYENQSVFSAFSPYASIGVICGSSISALLHDIGNAVNRNDHAHTGGAMAFFLLKERGMDPKDAATVASAIGNHDEKQGSAVDEVSAALILADKTDVRRSRVRNNSPADFDIHDKVNYAVIKSSVEVGAGERTITLSIELDNSWSSVMDYFQIFLERMAMCRRAAAALGCSFVFSANGTRLA